MRLLPGQPPLTHFLRYGRLGRTDAPLWWGGRRPGKEGTRRRGGFRDHLGMFRVSPDIRFRESDGQNYLCYMVPRCVPAIRYPRG